MYADAKADQGEKGGGTPKKKMKAPRNAKEVQAAVQKAMGGGGGGGEGEA